MLNENTDLYNKYIKEALECTKIVTLGLPKVIDEKLSKLNIVMVSDLSSLESKAKPQISKDELDLIMSARDKYIHSLGHMVDVSIDPENCTIGPINMYYELLLAIEKFEEAHFEQVELNILFMEKNSFSVERLNLILSLFKRRDIEWLKLRICSRKTFIEIASQYGVSPQLCRTRIAFMIKRIYDCHKMFIPNEGKTIICDDEYYQDITKKDDCYIFFLGLNERAYTALTRRGVFTIKELKEVIRNKKIFKIRDIGQKTYDTILEILGM